jgi:hypothetical protein
MNIRRLAPVLALAALAAGMSFGDKSDAGRLYVHFANGRVLVADNTYTEGEWTVVVMDAQNQIYVPSGTVMRIERVPQMERSVMNMPSSSFNVRPSGPSPDALSRGGGSGKPSPQPAYPGAAFQKDPKGEAAPPGHAVAPLPGHEAEGDPAAKRSPRERRNALGEVQRGGSRGR